MAIAKPAARTISPDCTMQEHWRCTGTYSKFNPQRRNFDPAKKWVRVTCDCDCHAKGAKR